MFHSLYEEYGVLRKALASVPNGEVKQKPIITLKDNRNLLVGHPLVKVSNVAFLNRPVTIVDRIIGNLRCDHGHLLMGFSVRSRPRTYICDICRRTDHVLSNPSFYCPLCDYDLCINCATRLAADKEPPRSYNDVVSSGFTVNVAGTPCHIGSGTPMLFCGKQYTSRGRCYCRSCDGRCGPTSGCPCPDCYVTFELILLSAGLRCSNNHVLTLSLYRAIPGRTTQCCTCHHRLKNRSTETAIGLVCEECGYEKSFMCCSCAYKAAISAE